MDCQTSAHGQSRILDLATGKNINANITIRLTPSQPLPRSSLRLIEPVFNSEIENAIEVANIACDKGHTAIRRDSRQQDVLKRKVIAGTCQGRHDISRSQGIVCIDRQDLKTVYDFALNPSPEGSWFVRTRSSVSQFKNRYRTDEEAGWGLIAQPGSDFEVGRFLNQLADNIGVEQKHGQLMEPDLAVRRWKTAQSANFFQRRKE